MKSASVFFVFSVDPLFGQREYLFFATPYRNVRCITPGLAGRSLK
jgi:hypothetical protein